MTSHNPTPKTVADLSEALHDVPGHYQGDRFLVGTQWDTKCNEHSHLASYKKSLMGVESIFKAPKAAREAEPL